MRTYDGTPVDEQDMVSTYDVEQQFADRLDEVYGTTEVAGLVFSTSRALQELDPIAYRTYFSNWLDSHYEEVCDDNGVELDYYVLREG